MSDSPPRGTELVLARKMHALVEELKCDIRVYGHSLADHTVEGVRSNGNQQLNTIVRDIDDLRQHLGDCRIELENLKEYNNEVACVLVQCQDEFDKDFQRCPKCKGMGGSGKCGSRDDPWRDCQRCKGRGSVSRDQ